MQQSITFFLFFFFFLKYRQTIVKLVFTKRHNFNPFPNKPWFLRVCSTSLMKTLWEKEKLLVTSNFSFSHSVFYPFLRTFCHFHRIKKCHLQTFSVWKSPKFVVWERVKGCIRVYDTIRARHTHRRPQGSLSGCPRSNGSREPNRMIFWLILN